MNGKRTEKALEQERREVIGQAPLLKPLRDRFPEDYAKILQVVWKAWDRTGHAGAPEGEDPADFMVSDQRGTARMLWYLGVDGTWRDCSWRRRKTSSSDPYKRVREAARDAVQAYCDDFARAKGRSSGWAEHVDHAITPFSDLFQAWVSSLIPEEQKEVQGSVASPPGSTLEEVKTSGHSGYGGVTGKSRFKTDAVGERFRKSWFDYHAANAVLQLLPAKENLAFGNQPHGLGQAPVKPTVKSAAKVAFADSNVLAAFFDDL
jgi:hypothetical protein